MNTLTLKQNSRFTRWDNLQLPCKNLIWFWPDKECNTKLTNRFISEWSDKIQILKWIITALNNCLFQFVFNILFRTSMRSACELSTNIQKQLIRRMHHCGATSECFFIFSTNPIQQNCADVWSQTWIVATLKMRYLHNWLYSNR